MKWKRTGITLLFGIVLGGLLAMNMRAPWMYSNDDNGAWFSAIARTHRDAGLRVTRGQDFFTSRETGELVPYLHHPPLPGLVLAAAFSVTGSDSPFMARLVFALLHGLTFVIIAGLARQLWDSGRNLLLYAYALAVAAVVPMSTFYGKMPNHEVPGLLFLIAGVTAWGFRANPNSSWRVMLALACWMLALFASWHAAFCIVAWLLLRWDREHRLRMTVSLAFILLTAGLAGLHLFWASHWQGIPSQAESIGHWSFCGSGASLAASASALQHAVGIGIGRYAYLPAVLAILWIVFLVKDRVSGHQPLSVQDRGLLGLCAGSVVYAVVFPHAVGNHAYQGFYLIPFVALASSLAIKRLCRYGTGRAFGTGRWMPLLLLALTCTLGVGMTLRMYAKVSPGAVKAAAAITGQYR